MSSMTQAFVEKTKIWDFIDSRPDLEIRICYFQGDIAFFPHSKKFVITSLENIDYLKEMFPDWVGLFEFCAHQINDDKGYEGIEDRVLTMSMHDEEFQGKIKRMMWSEWYDPENQLAWSIFNPPVYPKKADDEDE